MPSVLSRKVVYVKYGVCKYEKAKAQLCAPEFSGKAEERMESPMRSCLSPQPLRPIHLLNRVQCPRQYLVQPMKSVVRKKHRELDKQPDNEEIYSKNPFCWTLSWPSLQLFLQACGSERSLWPKTSSQSDKFGSPLLTPILETFPRFPRFLWRNA